MPSRRIVSVITSLSFCLATAAPPSTAPAVRLHATPATKEAGRSAFDWAPAVAERMSNIWTFQSDGTGRKESRMRVRVQQQAAVQGLGQLSFGYNSANENFELIQLKVTKPDGKIVTAGSEAVQEVTPRLPFASSAYTDYREKHVLVPALEPGDVLELAYAINVLKPDAPGQFWGQHQFAFQGVCLDESMEIRHPVSREVRFKVKPEFKSQTLVEGTTKIHRWAHSHMDEPPPEREEELAARFKRQFRQLQTRMESPDLQFTTFQSWGEVGDWYASLEGPQRVISPEIRTKSEALLSGQAGELDRIRALYHHVTQNYRYLSLSFGQGRYQPHTSPEVFASGYGDCKDKGSLLAAMLSKAGTPSEVALCNANRNIDPEVPSPAQFDHLIVHVPLAGESLWLDPTIPTSPFRSIAPSLRNKWTLVVRPGGRSELVRLPEELPFPTFQHLEAEGEVNEAGTLHLKTRVTLRNDAEMQVRAMFQNAPVEERNRVLARALELSGQVVAVEAKHLDSISEPIEFLITTQDEGFLDFSKGSKLTPKVPLPKLEATSTDEEDLTEERFLLAPALQQKQKITLIFPKGTSLRPTIPVNQSRTYGKYASTCKIEGERLEIERDFALNSGHLEKKAYRDWNAFRLGIEADQDQLLQVKWATESPLGGAAQKALQPSADPELLYKKACAEMERNNHREAISIFKQILALDPNHQNSLNNLGRCYVQFDMTDEAEKAYRKVIALDPFQPFAHNNLGVLLQRLGRMDEAEASLRKQIEVSPLDKWAHANLGSLLLLQHRDPEALNQLQQAWQITPDDLAVGVRLGVALLRTGDKEEARKHFEQLAARGSNPMLWNNIAYSLSENGGDLALALRLAEGSVNLISSYLNSTRLEENALQQFGQSLSASSSLDTLGWVHYRLGNAEKAMALIGAANQLHPSPEISGHLAQLLEEKGDRSHAIRELARTLMSTKYLAPAGEENPFPKLQLHLERLTGSKTKALSAVEKAKSSGYSERIHKVPAKLKKDGTGFLLLALDTNGKVLEIHFQNGEDIFGPLVPAIRLMTFPLGLPADAPIKRIVRGAVITAQHYNGEVALCLAESIPRPSRQSPPGNGATTLKPGPAPVR